MADAKVRVIFQGVDELSGAARRAHDGLREFTSGLGIAMGAATAMGAALTQAFRETVGATLEYADEVRRLSQVSGAGAEATSRFLQVLDDYKISAQEAEAAMRTMRTAGLTPTVESLAQASDEFLRLTPGIDRTNFLMERFGRQGANFADIMMQGADAIRDQAAAVQDGLILGDRELQQARELEIAIDNLNDSKQALAITIGTELLPGTVRAADALNQFLNEARVGESVFITLGRAIIDHMDLPLRHAIADAGDGLRDLNTLIRELPEHTNIDVSVSVDDSALVDFFSRWGGGLLGGAGGYAGYSSNVSTNVGGGTVVPGSGPAEGWAAWAAAHPGQVWQPGMQFGGLVPSQPFIAGERGPELIMGGRVFSNQQTQDILGAGAVVAEMRGIRDEIRFMVRNLPYQLRDVIGQ